MIPLRVRRDGVVRDVAVDLAGHTVSELVAQLGADGPVLDGCRVLEQAPAATVLYGGAELGGAISSARPAQWELAVAGGPRSGHRYLLGTGRYAIGDHAGTAIRVPGVPDGEVVLEVDPLGWSIEGAGIDTFDTAEGILLRIGVSWFTLRRHVDKTRRPPGRVNRPPRTVPPNVDRAVAIPELVDVSHRRREMRWAMFVGPVLIGGLMALFFQPFFALFALLGPVMAAAGWIEDTIKISRSGTKQEGADADRLATYRSDLERAVARAEAVERQRLGLPDAVRIALGSDSRLWERRSHHSDAGSVVIGYGSAPLCPAPSPSDPASSQAASDAMLAGIPIAVDVTPGRVVTLIDAQRRTGLAAAAVAQLAVWRGPCDLRIAVATDQPEAWEWAKWLPHVASDPLAGTRLLAAERSDIETLVQFCRDTDEDMLLVIDVADPVLLGLHDVLASPHIAALVMVHERAAVPGSTTQMIEDGTLRATWSAPPVRFDPIVPDPDALDVLARAMAAYQDPERRIVGSTLPATVALRSVDPICVDAVAVSNRWSVAPDGLRFAIGMGESGPLSLDLVADGPHALVAGTTGSGKSELLRTLIASLAATYSPDDLTFVLVDYKGGSAFDACAGLPHVVGMVTDLDGRLAERAKVSLEAELQRREHILRTHGADDISHFRAMGGTDLPRLVIVVDEFAALASDVPTFLDAVIDFAQRGRSLGVHLVLATQRPAGVVSEPIRANTNLRISLRVQSDHDARDVIGDPAPAALPRHVPGRAFVRTGPGELRTFQTASVTSAADRSEFTAVPFRFAMYPDMPLPTPGSRDLDSIVDAIAAAGTSCSEPFRPWQPPLPETILFDQVTSVGVGVGLEDQPERQTRTTWEWDPTVNLALVGTPESGASDTLETIVAHAASCSAGDDVGFYVIAGGGSTWPGAASLEAVGDVVPVSQTSRLRRLIAALAEEIEARRLAPWSTRIALAVDGVEAVLRALEREHATREALIAMAANGPAVGVTMVVAANRVGALPTAMSAAIGQRLLFQLADPFEYSAVGLKADRQPAPIRGRCVDPRVGHEIQMALTGLGDVVGRPRGWSLPEVADLPLVCKVTEVADHLDLVGSDWFLPIGIGDLSLGPVGWTLGPGEHALVIGSARSGKSTLLAGLASMLGERGGFATIVAARRSPLCDMPSLEVHAELTEGLLMSLNDQSVLLVDDAFRLPPDVFQQLLARRPDARIVATARPEDIRSGYTHWTKALRDLRTGVLLGPSSMADGELIGASLPRQLPSRHPGRGYLVADGRVELCQTIYG